ncbi:hypothetical protein [cf. Phormidesmis sp. LEGE 11477]|uniref:hypothetical protein n=1 Tax=cf. Phormidesmis sp. LEGE 11477 TaxID=1828680 RepID=UPI00187E1B85|nr:hypothetical protein [cf. Phormidesmis sp. LEGE 11477]MBE9062494.1 hypothetical protein [cf. Phormidesmis sp. LEGE 11477]
MSSYTQPNQPTNQPSDQETNQPSPAKPTNPEIPEIAIALPLPADVAISLATLPFLAVIVSGQIGARALTQWGNGSEEFFRGSRLPTLPLLRY